LIGGILNILLWSLTQHSDLQDLVFKTIFEISQHCRTKFGDNEFQLLFNYLESNYKSMKSEHVGMLMESVCTICAELPKDKLPLAVQ